MKSCTAISCLLLTLVAAFVAQAQEKTDAKPTFASVLERQLTSAEKTVVPAAEAMPEDKYGFAPTQGDFKTVRNFGAESNTWRWPTTHWARESSARSLR